MVDRSVKVTLRANVADFKAQMGQASKSLEDVAARSDKTGKVAETHLGRLAQHAQLQREQWNTVSTGLMTFGAVGVAAVGAAVKKFADFDAAMSEVQADTQESAANMELLRSAAIAAGADTQYSATEAAEAIDSLAKAGISTADILSGGLAGALDLAASGGLAVGDAAEIAATALTQFKLQGSDVGHVADLLAAGAGKAQGDVSDLGMALKQSGLVASQTGLSIDETTGALSAFASAGLLGSDAGTAFKSMLQRLTPQSKEAQSLMDELGISAYDAQGNFVGLANFAGNLQNSLAGLTTEQRNSAMATIFGSDAVRAASVFYEQGQAGVQGWIDKVNDSGYAARIAAQKTDNLKGDIERLGGSVETLFIKSGAGVAADLRSLAQGAEATVDAFGRLPGPVQQGVVSLLAVTAAGAGLVGVGMKVFTKISEVNTALTDLGLRGGKVEGALKGVSKALGVAAAATAAYAVFLNDLDNEWQANAEDATAFTNQIATVGKIDISKAFAGITDGYWGRQAVDVENFGDALQTAIDPGFWGRIDNAMTSFVGSVDTASLKAQQQFKGIGEALAGMSAQDLPRAQAAFKELWKAAGGDAASGAQLLQVMPAYKAALTEVATQMGIAIDDATLLKLANGELSGSIDGTTEAASGSAKAFGEQAEALQEALKTIADADASFISLQDAYKTVSDAAKSMAEDTASSTDSAEGSWEDYYDGVSFSMEEYLSALEEQVTAQQDWEQNMLLLSGRVSQGVIDELTRLGPEGAPLVANLVNASDEELSRLEGVYSQRSAEATGAFAANLQSAGPVFQEIMRKNGADAVAKAAEELSSGKKTMADIVAEYDLAFDVDAETGVATRKIRDVGAELAALPSEKRIRVFLDQVGWTQPSIPSSIALPGRASGGPIYGPGTGTSDSILARLSNGEYVVRAAQARRYRNLLDAINYGAPGYAGGGSVNAVPSYAQPRLMVGTSNTVVYVENPWTGEQLRARVRTESNRAAHAWDGS